MKVLQCIRKNHWIHFHCKGKVGGGIYNGGSMIISSDNFTKNIANVYGGAIYNYPKTLIVTNSNFTSNSAEYGGAIENSGTSTITRSTFTYNHAIIGGAIHNFGTASVHFNRIVGNTATLGSAISNYKSLNASLNWWGSNNGPGTKVNDDGDTNIFPWLVLKITSNPILIKKGGTSSITVDLLHDSNRVYHNPTSGHVPNGISVKFTNDSHGNMSPISTIMVNGQAKTIFTANIPGSSTITSTVDNHTVTAKITISPT